MKKSIQNNWTTYLSIFALVTTIAFGLSDNLSELAPVFLGISVLSIGGTIYRKNRKAQQSEPDAKRINKRLANASTAMAVLGTLAIGLGLFGLFSSSLSELVPAVIAGVLFLIVALLLRIFNGVLAKKIEASTGILSITTILLLVGVIVLMSLSAYVIYALLSGVGLL